MVGHAGTGELVGERGGRILDHHDDMMIVTELTGSGHGSDIDRIYAGYVRQVQHQALPRGDAHLGHDVRRVGRAADAVRPQFTGADVRVGPEDHLDGLGQIGEEIDLTRLTVGVIAQRP